MKLGLCTDAETAASLPELPFDFIEGHIINHLLPEESEEAFAPSLAAIQAAPLPMPAANCFLPPDLKPTGPDVNQERLRRWMETSFARARRAGIGIIVFGSGAARMVPEGWSLARGFEQYVDTLKLAAPIAEKNGIVVVVEPLQRGESNIVNTVIEGAESVERCGHPSVRLLADFFHMLRNDEDPDDLLKVGPLLHHCHFAEREERTAAGVKGDDFRPFFQALKKTGYNGMLAMECGWEDLPRQVGPAFEETRRQLGDAGY